MITLISPFVLPFYQFVQIEISANLHSADLPAKDYCNMLHFSFPLYPDNIRKSICPQLFRIDFCNILHFSILKSQCNNAFSQSSLQRKKRPLPHFNVRNSRFPLFLCFVICYDTVRPRKTCHPSHRILKTTWKNVNVHSVRIIISMQLVRFESFLIPPSHLQQCTSSK